DPVRAAEDLLERDRAAAPRDWRDAVGGSPMLGARSTSLEQLGSGLPLSGLYAPLPAIAGEGEFPPRRATPLSLIDPSRWPNPNEMRRPAPVPDSRPWMAPPTGAMSGVRPDSWGSMPAPGAGFGAGSLARPVSVGYSAGGPRDVGNAGGATNLDRSRIGGSGPSTLTPYERLFPIQASVFDPPGDVPPQPTPARPRSVASNPPTWQPGHLPFEPLDAGASPSYQGLPPPTPMPSMLGMLPPVAGSSYDPALLPPLGTSSLAPSSFGVPTPVFRPPSPSLFGVPTPGFRPPTRTTSAAGPRTSLVHGVTSGSGAWAGSSAQSLPVPHAQALANEIHRLAKTIWFTNWVSINTGTTKDVLQGVQVLAVNQLLQDVDQLRAYQAVLQAVLQAYTDIAALADNDRAAVNGSRWVAPRLSQETMAHNPVHRADDSAKPVEFQYVLAVVLGVCRYVAESSRGQWLVMSAEYIRRDDVFTRLRVDTRMQWWWVWDLLQANAMYQDAVRSQRESGVGWSGNGPPPILIRESPASKPYRAADLLALTLEVWSKLNGRRSEIVIGEIPLHVLIVVAELTRRGIAGWRMSNTGREALARVLFEMMRSLRQANNNFTPPESARVHFADRTGEKRVKETVAYRPVRSAVEASELIEAALPGWFRQADVDEEVGGEYLRVYGMELYAEVRRIVLWRYTKRGGRTQSIASAMNDVVGLVARTVLAVRLRKGLGFPPTNVFSILRSGILHSITVDWSRYGPGSAGGSGSREVLVWRVEPVRDQWGVVVAAGLVAAQGVLDRLVGVVGGVSVDELARRVVARVVGAAKVVDAAGVGGLVGGVRDVVVQALLVSKDLVSRDGLQAVVGAGVGGAVREVVGVLIEQGVWGWAGLGVEVEVGVSESWAVRAGVDWGVGFGVVAQRRLGVLAAGVRAGWEAEARGLLVVAVRGLVAVRYEGFGEAEAAATAVGVVGNHGGSRVVWLAAALAAHAGDAAGPVVSGLVAELAEGLVGRLGLLAGSGSNPLDDSQFDALARAYGNAKRKDPTDPTEADVIGGASTSRRRLYEGSSSGPVSATRPQGGFPHVFTVVDVDRTSYLEAELKAGQLGKQYGGAVSITKVILTEARTSVEPNSGLGVVLDEPELEQKILRVVTDQLRVTRQVDASQTHQQLVQAALDAGVAAAGVYLVRGRLMSDGLPEVWIAYEAGRAQLAHSKIGWDAALTEAAQAQLANMSENDAASLRAQATAVLTSVAGLLRESGTVSNPDELAGRDIAIGADQVDRLAAAYKTHADDPELPVLVYTLALACVQTYADGQARRIPSEPHSEPHPEWKNGQHARARLWGILNAVKTWGGLFDKALGARGPASADYLSLKSKYVNLRSKLDSAEVALGSVFGLVDASAERVESTAAAKMTVEVESLARSALGLALLGNVGASVSTGDPSLQTLEVRPLKLAELSQLELAELGIRITLMTNLPAGPGPTTNASRLPASLPESGVVITPLTAVQAADSFAVLVQQKGIKEWIEANAGTDEQLRNLCVIVSRLPVGGRLAASQYADQINSLLTDHPLLVTLIQKAHRDIARLAMQDADSDIRPPWSGNTPLTERIREFTTDLSRIETLSTLLGICRLIQQKTGSWPTIPFDSPSDGAGACFAVRHRMVWWRLWDHVKDDALYLKTIRNYQARSVGGWDGEGPPPVLVRLVGEDGDGRVVRIADLTALTAKLLGRFHFHGHGLAPDRLPDDLLRVLPTVVAVLVGNGITDSTMPRTIPDMLGRVSFAVIRATRATYPNRELSLNQNVAFTVAGTALKIGRIQYPQDWSVAPARAECAVQATAHIMEALPNWFEQCGVTLAQVAEGFAPKHLDGDLEAEIGRTVLQTFEALKIDTRSSNVRRVNVALEPVVELVAPRVLAARIVACIPRQAALPKRFVVRVSSSKSASYGVDWSRYVEAAPYPEAAAGREVVAMMVRVERADPDGIAKALAALAAKRRATATNTPAGFEPRPTADSISVLNEAEAIKTAIVRTSIVSMTETKTDSGTVIDELTGLVWRAAVRQLRISTPADPPRTGQIPADRIQCDRDAETEVAGTYRRRKRFASIGSSKRLIEYQGGPSRDLSSVGDSDRSSDASWGNTLPSAYQDYVTAMLDVAPSRFGQDFLARVKMTIGEISPENVLELSEQDAGILLSGLVGVRAINAPYRTSYLPRTGWRQHRNADGQIVAMVNAAASILIDSVTRRVKWGLRKGGRADAPQFHVAEQADGWSLVSQESTDKFPLTDIIEDRVLPVPETDPVDDLVNLLFQSSYYSITRMGAEWQLESDVRYLWRQAWDFVATGTESLMQAAFVAVTDARAGLEALRVMLPRGSWRRLPNDGNAFKHSLAGLVLKFDPALESPLDSPGGVVLSRVPSRVPLEFGASSPAYRLDTTPEGNLVMSRPGSLDLLLGTVVDSRSPLTAGSTEDPDTDESVAKKSDTEKPLRLRGGAGPESLAYITGAPGSDQILPASSTTETAGSREAGALPPAVGAWENVNAKVFQDTALSFGHFARRPGSNLPWTATPEQVLDAAAHSSMLAATERADGWYMPDSFNMIEDPSGFGTRRSGAGAVAENGLVNYARRPGDLDSELSGLGVDSALVPDPMVPDPIQDQTPTSTGLTRQQAADTLADLTRRTWFTNWVKGSEYVSEVRSGDFDLVDALRTAYDDLTELARGDRWDPFCPPTVTRADTERANYAVMPTSSLKLIAAVLGICRRIRLATGKWPDVPPGPLLGDGTLIMRLLMTWWQVWAEVRDSQEYVLAMLSLSTEAVLGWSGEGAPPLLVGSDSPIRIGDLLSFTVFVMHRLASPRQARPRSELESARIYREIDPALLHVPTTVLARLIDDEFTARRMPKTGKAARARVVLEVMLTLRVTGSGWRPASRNEVEDVHPYASGSHGKRRIYVSTYSVWYAYEASYLILNALPDWLGSAGIPYDTMKKDFDSRSEHLETAVRRVVLQAYVPEERASAKKMWGAIGTAMRAVVAMLAPRMWLIAPASSKDRLPRTFVVTGQEGMARQIPVDWSPNERPSGRTVVALRVVLSRAHQNVVDDAARMAARKREDTDPTDLVDAVANAGRVLLERSGGLPWEAVEADVSQEVRAALSALHEDVSLGYRIDVALRATANAVAPAAMFSRAVATGLPPRMALRFGGQTEFVDLEWDQRFPVHAEKTLADLAGIERRRLLQLARQLLTDRVRVDLTERTPELATEQLDAAVAARISAYRPSQLARIAAAISAAARRRNGELRDGQLESLLGQLVKQDLRHRLIGGAGSQRDSDSVMLSQSQAGPSSELEWQPGTANATDAATLADRSGPMPAEGDLTPHEVYVALSSVLNSWAYLQAKESDLWRVGLWDWWERVFTAFDPAQSHAALAPDVQLAVTSAKLAFRNIEALAVEDGIHPGWKALFDNAGDQSIVVSVRPSDARLQRLTRAEVAVTLAICRHADLLLVPERRDGAADRGRPAWTSSTAVPPEPFQLNVIGPRVRWWRYWDAVRGSGALSEPVIVAIDGGRGAVTYVADLVALVADVLRQLAQPVGPDGLLTDLDSDLLLPVLAATVGRIVAAREPVENVVVWADAHEALRVVGTAAAVELRRWNVPELAPPEIYAHLGGESATRISKALTPEEAKNALKSLLNLTVYKNTKAANPEHDGLWGWWDGVAVALDPTRLDDALDATDLLNDLNDAVAWVQQAFRDIDGLATLDSSDPWRQLFAKATQFRSKTMRPTDLYASRGARAKVAVLLAICRHAVRLLSADAAPPGTAGRRWPGWTSDEVQDFMRWFTVANRMGWWRYWDAVVASGVLSVPVVVAVGGAQPNAADGAQPNEYVADLVAMAATVVAQLTQPVRVSSAGVDLIDDLLPMLVNTVWAVVTRQVPVDGVVRWPNAQTALEVVGTAAVAQLIINNPAIDLKHRRQVRVRVGGIQLRIGLPDLLKAGWNEVSQITGEIGGPGPVPGSRDPLDESGSGLGSTGMGEEGSAGEVRWARPLSLEDVLNPWVFRQADDSVHSPPRLGAQQDESWERLASPGGPPAYEVPESVRPSSPYWSASPPAPSASVMGSWEQAGLGGSGLAQLSMSDLTPAEAEEALKSVLSSKAYRSTRRVNPQPEALWLWCELVRRAVDLKPIDRDATAETLISDAVARVREVFRDVDGLANLDTDGAWRQLFGAGGCQINCLVWPSDRDASSKARALVAVALAICRYADRSWSVDAAPLGASGRRRPVWTSTRMKASDSRALPVRSRMEWWRLWDAVAEARVLPLALLSLPVVVALRDGSGSRSYVAELVALAAKVMAQLTQPISSRGSMTELDSDEVLAELPGTVHRILTKNHPVDSVITWDSPSSAVLAVGTAAAVQLLCYKPRINLERRPHVRVSFGGKETAVSVTTIVTAAWAEIGRIFGEIPVSDRIPGTSGGPEPEPEPEPEPDSGLAWLSMSGLTAEEAEAALRSVLNLTTYGNAKDANRQHDALWGWWDGVALAVGLVPVPRDEAAKNLVSDAVARVQRAFHDVDGLATLDASGLAWKHLFDAARVRSPKNAVRHSDRDASWAARAMVSVVLAICRHADELGVVEASRRQRPAWTKDVISDRGGRPLPIDTRMRWWRYWDAVVASHVLSEPVVVAVGGEDSAQPKEYVADLVALAATMVGLVLPAGVAGARFDLESDELLQVLVSTVRAVVTLQVPVGGVVRWPDASKALYAVGTAAAVEILRVTPDVVLGRGPRESSVKLGSWKPKVQIAKLQRLAEDETGLLIREVPVSGVPGPVPGSSGGPGFSSGSGRNIDAPGWLQARWSGEGAGPVENSVGFHYWPQLVGRSRSRKPTFVNHARPPGYPDLAWTDLLSSDDVDLRLGLSSARRGASSGPRRGPSPVLGRAPSYGPGGLGGGIGFSAVDSAGQWRLDNGPLVGYPDLVDPQGLYTDAANLDQANSGPTYRPASVRPESTLPWQRLPSVYDMLPDGQDRPPAWPMSLGGNSSVGVPRPMSVGPDTGRSGFPRPASVAGGVGGSGRAPRLPFAGVGVGGPWMPDANAVQPQVLPAFGQSSSGLAASVPVGPVQYERPRSRSGQAAAYGALGGVPSSLRRRSGSETPDALLTSLAEVEDVLRRSGRAQDELQRVLGLAVGSSGDRFSALAGSAVVRPPSPYRSANQASSLGPSNAPVPMSAMGSWGQAGSGAPGLAQRSLSGLTTAEAEDALRSVLNIKAYREAKEARVNKPHGGLWLWCKDVGRAVDLKPTDRDAAAKTLVSDAVDRVRRAFRDVDGLATLDTNLPWQELFDAQGSRINPSVVWPSDRDISLKARTWVAVALAICRYADVLWSVGAVPIRASERRRPVWSSATMKASDSRALTVGSRMAWWRLWDAVAEAGVLSLPVVVALGDGRGSRSCVAELVALAAKVMAQLTQPISGGGSMTELDSDEVLGELPGTVDRILAKNQTAGNVITWDGPSSAVLAVGTAAAVQLLLSKPGIRLERRPYVRVSFRGKETPLSVTTIVTAAWAEVGQIYGEIPASDPIPGSTSGGSGFSYGSGQLRSRSGGEVEGPVENSLGFYYWPQLVGRSRPRKPIFVNNARPPGYPGLAWTDLLNSDNLNLGLGSPDPILEVLSPLPVPDLALFNSLLVPSTSRSTSRSASRSASASATADAPREASPVVPRANEVQLRWHSRSVSPPDGSSASSYWPANPPGPGYALEVAGAGSAPGPSASAMGSGAQAGSDGPVPAWLSVSDLTDEEAEAALKSALNLRAYDKAKAKDANREHDALWGWWDGVAVAVAVRSIIRYDAAKNLVSHAAARVQQAFRDVDRLATLDANNPAWMQLFDAEGTQSQKNAVRPSDRDASREARAKVAALLAISRHELALVGTSGRRRPAWTKDAITDSGRTNLRVDTRMRWWRYWDAVVAAGDVLSVPVVVAVGGVDGVQPTVSVADLVALAATMVALLVLPAGVGGARVDLEFDDLLPVLVSTVRAVVTRQVPVGGVVRWPDANMALDAVGTAAAVEILRVWPDFVLGRGRRELVVNLSRHRNSKAKAVTLHRLARAELGELTGASDALPEILASPGERSAYEVAGVASQSAGVRPPLPYRSANSPGPSVSAVGSWGQPDLGGSGLAQLAMSGLTPAEAEAALKSVLGFKGYEDTRRVNPQPEALWSWCEDVRRAVDLKATDRDAAAETLISDAVSRVQQAFADVDGLATLDTGHPWKGLFDPDGRRINLSVVWPSDLGGSREGRAWVAVALAVCRYADLLRPVGEPSRGAPERRRPVWNSAGMATKGDSELQRVGTRMAWWRLWDAVADVRVLRLPVVVAVGDGRRPPAYLADLVALTAKVMAQLAQPISNRGSMTELDSDEVLAELPGTVHRILTKNHPVDSV
ncbi:MAG: hypothetical protein JWN95_135, partial [Frankiales bacterium]|nr:hypothetical protein [Frankiales bacterium]